MISPEFTRKCAPIALAVLASVAPMCVFAGPADATLVTKVEPEFPREAIQAGADRGVVKARMTLDGSGEVTRVEVLEANPRRVFDRAVVKTLSQWKFNPGNSGRAVEIEVEFKR
jgi:periplasmic protein TonB